MRLELEGGSSSRTVVEKLVALEIPSQRFDLVK